MKRGPHPGPFGVCPLRYRRDGQAFWRAVADLGESKGADVPRAGLRETKAGFSPDGRHCRPRTPPTPLTAGTGPRDSQNIYALLTRAAARRADLRQRRKAPNCGAAFMVPPKLGQSGHRLVCPRASARPAGKQAG